MRIPLTFILPQSYSHHRKRFACNHLTHIVAYKHSTTNKNKFVPTVEALYNNKMITNPNITLDLIRSKHDHVKRKTKIVCTLGPACWSEEGLGGLIDQGMNIARFNFSHGDHSTHSATLARLRAAAASRPDCNIGVMLDTKGPEIRTGFVDKSLGGKVKYTKGDKIEVGTDYSKPCTPQYLACSYTSLPKSVKVGGTILVADGSLSLEIEEILPTSVMCRVMNNASIGDTKNMNLPGCIVDLPTLTAKDIDDIVKWGLVEGVDFIAASFVRKPSDILFIREVLGKAGAHVKIISKIENQEGLDNYKQILEVTDGVMVARGDLGMEIPIEKVFLAQKMMIHEANIAGRPVITATQMLESMITNPRPTRAECADVANAVIDGSDAVMLSGETANGEYPEAAVHMMSSTCLEAESVINYDAQFAAIRSNVLALNGHITPAESVASSAVKTASDVGASLIVVLTESGSSARLVAKYRPGIPIVAITPSDSVARQAQGYFKNVFARVVPAGLDSDESLVLALDFAKGHGWIKSGDKVVYIHGSQKNIAGSTNLLRIVTSN